jgi:hypothetical protein
VVESRDDYYRTVTGPLAQVTTKSRCDSGVNGNQRGQSAQESSKSLNLVYSGAFHRLRMKRATNKIIAQEARVEYLRP